MHTAGYLDDRSSVDIDNAQSTEPALVASERDPPGIRRDGKRPLAHPPTGATVLERLLDQRLVVEPQVEPSVVVAERNGRAARHQPNLLD